MQKLCWMVGLCLLLAACKGAEVKASEENGDSATVAIDTVARQAASAVPAETTYEVLIQGPSIALVSSTGLRLEWKQPTGTPNNYRFATAYQGGHLIFVKLFEDDQQIGWAVADTLQRKLLAINTQFEDTVAGHLELEGVSPDGRYVLLEYGLHNDLRWMLTTTSGRQLLNVPCTRFLLEGFTPEQLKTKAPIGWQPDGTLWWYDVPVKQPKLPVAKDPELYYGRARKWKNGQTLPWQGEWEFVHMPSTGF